MPRKSFDNLANSYHWLEAITFGNFLQKCRTALMPQLLDARKVLILGEGDGRFLEAFCKANPKAAVDCLDISPSMTSRARKRIQRMPEANGRVQFHVGDALANPLPTGPYDLVVCNFFLDCFNAKEIASILLKIKEALQPGGRILVGDFRNLQKSLMAPLSQLLLASMYCFFRITTGISAKTLVDTTPLLQEVGFTPLEQKNLLFGFLNSSIWSAGGIPGGPLNDCNRQSPS